MNIENTNTKVLLRHLVLFKFYDHVDLGIIKEVETRFASLEDQITLIKGYEWGPNISEEGLSNGFTHCFMLTFDDEKNRDAYIVHPAHQAFVAFINPYLDSACVVDYWT